MLRCIEDIEKATKNLPLDSPILLSREDTVTHLITQKIHQKLFHTGFKIKKNRKKTGSEKQKIDEKLTGERKYKPTAHP